MRDCFWIKIRRLNPPRFSLSLLHPFLSSSAAFLLIFLGAAAWPHRPLARPPPRPPRAPQAPRVCFFFFPAVCRFRCLLSRTIYSALPNPHTPETNTQSHKYIYKYCICINEYKNGQTSEMQKLAHTHLQTLRMRRRTCVCVSSRHWCSFKKKKKVVPVYLGSSQP